MTAANTHEPRKDVRSNVFLSAVLALRSGSRGVRVRNISRLGALLDGKGLPPKGTAVRLRRGDLCIAGQVAWQDGDNCGVCFDASIDLAPWLMRVGHSGQHRVDNVLAALRTGHELNAEQGDKVGIDEISAELTRISEDLGDLPDLTMQLAEKVLQIDAVAQRLRNWIAAR